MAQYRYDPELQQIAVARFGDMLRRWREQQGWTHSWMRRLMCRSLQPRASAASATVSSGRPFLLCALLPVS